MTPSNKPSRSVANSPPAPRTPTTGPSTYGNRPQQRPAHPSSNATPTGGFCVTARTGTDIDRSGTATPCSTRSRSRSSRPVSLPDGDLQQRGIPAALVTRFLDERGIVVEKTGAYCFLVLFSLGITRGKAGTLLAELFEFKRLHDQDAPLTQTLPRLVDEHPGRYGTLTLRTLADEMQTEPRDSALTELTEGMYAALPEPVTNPATAYEQLITGTTEMVEVDKLAGRVSAAMVVPYPPGIPVIMPSERFPTADSALLRYLRQSGTRHLLPRLRDGDPRRPRPARRCLPDPLPSH